MLLYEMLFGRTPFKGDRKKPTYERIFDPKFLASFPEVSCVLTVNCKLWIVSFLTDTCP